jgi:hypothetical protein
MRKTFDLPPPQRKLGFLSERIKIRVGSKEKVEKPRAREHIEARERKNAHEESMVE